MGRFDRQIATAKRLIAKNGQKVIWRQISNGVPASATEPWKVGPAVNTDHDVIICFLPFTTENKEFLRALLGTEVATGSVTGLMAAVNFTPAKRDIVIRDGKTYSIKTIDPLRPNEQTIMYTLEFDVSDNVTYDANSNALNEVVDALEEVIEELPE